MGLSTANVRRDILLRALARAFVAGEQTPDAIAARVTHLLGRRWSWLAPCIRHYLLFCTGRTRPRQREIIALIDTEPEFYKAWERHGRLFSVSEWIIEPPRMQPVAAAAPWPIPKLETVGALAEWLVLKPAQLDWLADLKGLTYPQAESRLHHYHYSVLAKRSGGVRLIEIPKPTLKELQRQILGGILNAIPAHPAVHGFVPGRSIQTFVAPHVGQAMVLSMDLHNFFPNFPGTRIQSLFRTLGYPEAVADLLGGLCTNSTPAAVLSQCDWQTRQLYRRPHLPQGSPSSPALANLCAYRLDCRLSALATSLCLQYTRYADDLAFSGGPAFARDVRSFSTLVSALVLQGGFTVNHRKTRRMSQGGCQHLAGLVVNKKLNVNRADFDQLKATLTNCVRHGPENQNRTAHPAFRAHLEGRVSFFESVNGARGLRLRQILDQIIWPAY